jgi:hypothetical protein
MKKKKFYCVVSETICEILSPFVSDLILGEIDLSECLYESRNRNGIGGKRERY